MLPASASAPLICPLAEGVPGLTLLPFWCPASVTSPLASDGALATVGASLLPVMVTVTVSLAVALTESVTVMV